MVNLERCDTNNFRHFFFADIFLHEQVPRTLIPTRQNPTDRLFYFPIGDYSNDRDKGSSLLILHI
jgi:hypothetical protein